MKIVDARSLGAVHTHTHTHTHIRHLLTKVSLLNVNNIPELCLLIKIVNKYNVKKTETESIY